MNDSAGASETTTATSRDAGVRSPDLTLLTPPPSRRATELLARIDWKALSPEAQETIQTIGPLLVADCSRSEIADQLDLSLATVTKRMQELEREIREQVENR